MIRLTLTIIGIFLFGILVGYVIPKNDSEPISSAFTVAEISDEDELYQQTLAKRDLKIDSLVEEKTNLKEQLEQTRLEMEKLKTTHKETVMALVSEEAPEDTEDSSIEEVELREEEQEARQLEREQRREEFASHIRDSIAERWGNTWDNAPPDSQKRISEIAQYQQELFDMRMNIRSAETDEERFEMIKAAEELNDSIKSTIKTEQNVQLTRIAEKYGITKPKDVKGFLNETQSQLENPVFQSDFSRRGGFGGHRGGRSSRAARDRSR
jgi:hypothetical protein